MKILLILLFSFNALADLQSAKLEQVRLEERATYLEKDLARLVQQNAKLKARFKSLSTENSRLRSDNATLERKIADKTKKKKR